MLIKCPRCGFQQPKDQYCAQCGIDIEAFVPEETPLIKKVFGNLFVQLFFLAAAAVIIGTTLFKNEPKKNLARREFRDSSVQVSSSTFNNGETALEEEVTQNIDKSDSFPPPPLPVESGSPLPASVQEGAINAYKVVPPNSNEVSDKSKSATEIKNSQIIVYYAEVSKESLATLFVNSRASGDFMESTEYSAGLIPNIQKVIGSPQVKILRKELKPLERAKGISWFLGVKNQYDPANDIGITTVLEVSENENGSLQGSLEIQRTWREMGPGGEVDTQKKSFPAEFELDNDSGFFMSGVMPRRSNLDNERELTNIDIYRILSSAQFKSGESHFVIFIDFEK